ncbi:alpha-(1,3)-fucosyltransferase 7-like [Orussus abietinus]|uniref:alpha-(1,3)-fucosyltransferase 7-like n=1 Tax=Orussus abietinus TaxID=222816 RepID=UPI0006258E58|nr:alpha-(1,3)-fucosyltransferase 7-like [Orussus abietinus]
MVAGRYMLILCLCGILAFYATLRVPREESVAGFSGEGFLPPVTWSPFESRYVKDQVRSSRLARWLTSVEGSPPPPVTNPRKEPFLILVWQHGPFLENRHIRRFSNKTFSPWEGCSVDGCRLSYERGDLDRADAVLFHLHRTRGVRELPRRTRRHQRWVFLTDESPLNTFLLNGRQRLSDYDGLFNWSMTYRLDSDVPVPYGRTVKRATESAPVDPNGTPELAAKDRLVAILASNCRGANARWSYVRELKSTLGDRLDVYGRCLGGNTTACPGHFFKDCAVLAAYKFYLAFENSNCREYVTEKAFWNGYHKFSVPVIMGASKKSCESVLPPRSFLHVDDFDSPVDLANYLKYLDGRSREYYRFHEWRRYYKVINEHGYFGSASKHYCRLCEALHYNSPDEKIYHDLEAFWSKERDCAT